MRAVTLASRPDLAEAVYAIPYPADSPRFMRGDLASLLVRGRRIAERWPHLVVALPDGDRPRRARDRGRLRGGAPARVHVSTSQNVAVYVEPNVCVSHTVPTG